MVLSNTVVGSWLVCGDFNNPLSPDDRVGSPVRWSEIQGFQSCLDFCGLSDPLLGVTLLGTISKQGCIGCVASWIECWVMMSGWLLLLIFIPRVCWIIHQLCSALICILLLRRDLPFRYLNLLSLAPDFLHKVRMCWDEQVGGVPMYRVVMKLKKLKQVFRLMKTNGFGDVQQAEFEAHAHLIQCQRNLHASPEDEVLVSQERDAASQYDIAHNKYGLNACSSF